MHLAPEEISALWSLGVVSSDALCDDGSVRGRRYVEVYLSWGTTVLLTGAVLTACAWPAEVVARPDPARLAREVIEGKAAAFSPTLKRTAVRAERLGSIESEYGVDFVDASGRTVETLAIFHEVYGDGNDAPDSHPSMEAAIEAGAPKLAEWLADGGYVALPRLAWSKGASLDLDALGLRLTWKDGALSAARGKGKPVRLKAVEKRGDGYDPPAPVAIFAAPGQPVIVLAVRWASSEPGVVSETEMFPLSTGPVAADRPAPGAPGSSGSQP